MAREARHELPPDAGARLTVGRWLAGHTWVPVLSIVALTVVIVALAVLSLSPSSPGPPRASVSVVNSGLGKLLVDRRGLTLYLYTNDGPSKSACFEACARVWPPATISARPTTGPSVSAQKLKTIRRPNNARQLVYNGHPLYTFSGDARPGQRGGENFLGTWYVISPAGRQIKGPGATTAPGY
ncbi:MAG: hypothetical protein M3Z95_09185 [Actinomycetota bacterium]|nr:hypothetical protein [Actinomycetota bacterium]